MLFVSLSAQSFPFIATPEYPHQTDCFPASSLRQPFVTHANIRALLQTKYIPPPSISITFLGKLNPIPPYMRYFFWHGGICEPQNMQRTLSLFLLGGTT